MIKIRLASGQTNLTNATIVMVGVTGLFSNATILDGSTLQLTLADDYSWHSTISGRRVVNWSGQMLSVANSQLSTSTFQLKVYSLPWGHGLQEYGVSVAITSATDIKIFVDIVPHTPIDYAPVDSIFFSATGNFSFIFIFTFFN
jgi:hypothetical protein